MGTKSYVEELEYTDAKGLDTTSPINLLSSGFVRVANNVNLGYTGGYTKREGYLNQFTPANQLNGYRIEQGLEYRRRFQPNITPNIDLVLYATNGTTGKLGKLVVGSFVEFVDNTNTPISTAVPILSPTNRPSFAQVNNSLFVINGANEPYVYEENGNYTRKMGISAPTTAPSAAVNAISGKLNIGQYLYAYNYAFYHDGQLIAESSPSEVSATVTTTAGNTQVTLTLTGYPQASDANLSHLDIYIRVFRTVVNGSILFLESEFIAGTGSITYVSGAPVTGISDDGLQSEQLSFDNTKLIDYVDYTSARFPVVARNRIILFHNTANIGRFSKIGVNGPLPESFPVANEFSIEGKFGAADGLVGAGQIKGVPIILKERSIGRLEEVGLPDLGNSDDSVAMVYREISETVGAVSHFAQCQVFDELVFLGRDNVYATDGQNVRPIATQIQSLIKVSDFSGTKASKLSAINDTKNRRVYIQIFKDTNSVEPDVTLVGDYQQYPAFRWTTYEKGPEADMPGIKAGCFFQTEATVNGGLDVYFGSATDEGQYYKMNTGRSDYKSALNAISITPSKIYMKLISRPYMLAQPMVTKLYKSARIYAEGNAQSYTFDFGAIYDLGQNEVGTTEFLVPGTNTTWNNYNWSPPIDVNTLFWSGQALNEFVFRMHRKAKMMQLAFTQNDLDAPVTLLGWGISGSVFSGI